MVRYTYYPFLVTRARVIVDCWRLAPEKSSFFSACVIRAGDRDGTAIPLLSSSNTWGDAFPKDVFWEEMER
jgi:hypothetical protein